ncbi:MAG TPA: bifunctional DNA-formamidopyrimidine glycosylase/DNA-(apurinic or apyrimidinic site) lyase [Tepidisphaeraceae bacterium]|nr:bifunctional DNA-formamidopyrimidine glycosylase/DNA-(apurinic or apyrimidinic site) lyase [Tepidisphaeraceae bacterium]
MPELPEVQTVVTTLRPRLLGRTITGLTLHRPDILTPASIDFRAKLVGGKVVAVERRGKRIVFSLSTGDRFYVHLGMTGQLTVTTPDAALATHTHLVVDFGRQHQLRFRDPRRFGGVWWLGRETPCDERMGPEPLTIRPQQLAKRLATTKRAVKVALLDQRLIAGLGNIYVDEALFAAGIHPLTCCNALTREQIGRLNRSIQATLNRAIHHRGSTLRDYLDADGAAGGFQRLHRVYDRAGEACRRCRTAIERIVLGGRSTHFCPTCQRLSDQSHSA